MKILSALVGLLFMVPVMAMAQDIKVSPPISSGTWTPALTGSTSGTAVMTNQVGSYSISGNQWTARFLIDFTGAGTISGQIRLSGLPWTQANIANDYGSCFFGESSGITFPNSGTSLGAWVSPNANFATLYASGTGSTGGTVGAITSGEIIGTCTGHT